MKEFDLNKLVRDNIRSLKPYSSARDEYKGKQGIFLDANENSLGSTVGGSLNRYPDPLQLDLKEQISKIKGLPIENIFLGNGSDEAIDLMIRAFCEPGKEKVIICPPTYGMYQVSADINNVKAINIPLSKDFQLDSKKVLEATDSYTKIIFICSPNNPTGNSINRKDIETLLTNFNGIILLDEAYINFSRQRSCIDLLTKYPNLVIIQTFSKAWGLAGIRLGMLFASQQIVDVINKIKPPYNINQLTQATATEALRNLMDINQQTIQIVEERDKLKTKLEEISIVKQVHPSDANFLLVEFENAKEVYNFLSERSVIVRDRSSVIGCEECLRITVGSTEENTQLLKLLKSNYG